MGLAKDLGHLNDDVTIFKEEVIGENDFGEIKQWVGTVYKGLYRDITKMMYNKTQEQVSATGYFIIDSTVKNSVYYMFNLSDKNYFDLGNVNYFNLTQKETDKRVFIELRDGKEERICLGSYAGHFQELPEFAREILSKKDNRRMFEIKNGLPPTEWKVYVK